MAGAATVVAFNGMRLDVRAADTGGEMILIHQVWVIPAGWSYDVDGVIRTATHQIWDGYSYAESIFRGSIVGPPNPYEPFLESESSISRQQYNDQGYEPLIPSVDSEQPKNSEGDLNHEMKTDQNGGPYFEFKPGTNRLWRYYHSPGGVPPIAPTPPEAPLS